MERLSLGVAEKHLAEQIVRALEHWYARVRDRYEFRYDRNPYRTWITEIFLQQTQINAARIRLQAFLKKFPDVATLAASSLDEVLTAFRGMGYYSRARNLHRAAAYMMANYAGEVPVRYTELKKIPGIGHYTAAIIASIYNRESVLACDANQVRVLSRLFAIPHEQNSKAFTKRAQELASPLFASGLAPGDLNEALMQWGQEICKKKPRCEVCFAQDLCVAYSHKTQHEYPAKRPKKEALPLVWCMFICRQGERYQVFEAGRSFPFLQGELIFPGLLVLPPEKKEVALPAALPNDLRRRAKDAIVGAPGDFHHAITRYRITVRLLRAPITIAKGQFLTTSELRARCHSSLMQKAIALLDKRQELLFSASGELS